VLVGTGEAVGVSVGQNTGVLVNLGVGVQVDGHVGCGVQVGVGGRVVAGWDVDACAPRYDLSSEITIYAPAHNSHVTARARPVRMAICRLVMVHFQTGNAISTVPHLYHSTLKLA
jgi:hypothetical protein